MSLVIGVLAGLPIAMLEVATKHLRVGIGPFALDRAALAVPFVLVPVGLFWGWTWASERWAKRATPPLILYTAGFYLALSLVGPLDMAVFWPQIDVALLVAEIPGLAVLTVVFALPAFLAAILFWAFGSGRLPTNALTLTIGYLIGPAVALLAPALAIGTVAGTAAGHAWRAPNSRNAIAFFVIVLMLLIAFALPYGLAAAGLATTPVRPLLP